MNASNSTTPTGERLTDTRRKIQWKYIDWKTVTKSVNRLQVRITKAIIEIITAAQYIKGYGMLERYQGETFTYRSLEERVIALSYSATDARIYAVSINCCAPLFNISTTCTHNCQRVIPSLYTGGAV